LCGYERLAAVRRAAGALFDIKNGIFGAVSRFVLLVKSTVIAKNVE
jgi:hypothetical protein